MDTAEIKVIGLPVTGGRMSNESGFSNVLEAGLPDLPPMAPVIKSVTFVKKVAQVVVTVPTTDADGSDLTGLTNCYVFVKTSEFLPTPAEERALGTPSFSVDVTDKAGQDVTVEVPDLKYGQTYFFAATCVD